MIEIGDGRGDFPSTPQTTENSHNAEQSNQPNPWDIPEDALFFAQKMLKNFLMSMTDQEADCKCYLRSQ